MATLPNLDTTTAGHVAYYNVVNNTALGEAAMTWSDVTDNGNINSFEVYDNGYIFQYNDGDWNEVTIRVKTDGWVVAYTGWDGNVNGFNGPSAHNIMTSPARNPSGLINNRLAQHIRDVVTDLSEWSALGREFDKSNVGLYEFNYQSYALSYFHEKGTGSRTVNEAAGTVTDHAVVAADIRAQAGGIVTFSVDGTQVSSVDNTSETTGIREVTTSIGQTDESTTTIGVGAEGASRSRFTYVLYWSEA